MPAYTYCIRNDIIDEVGIGYFISFVWSKHALSWYENFLLLHADAYTTTLIPVFKTLSSIGRSLGCQITVPFSNCSFYSL